MSFADLPEWTATDLAAGIRSREISAVEVMRAHLDRIEELNPILNSIVASIPASEALEAADLADQAVARGDSLGLLHGLPTAVKDLLDVKGLPTTFGSAAFVGAAPAERDSLLVQRVRAAGGIIIGKTNTPEHGVGTLTFNAVHGVTRNPWDTSRHAGGSSGAAAAIAAGLLPVADGSDSGGSLRYPSSFCNTVGLRPTAGRIPVDTPHGAWSPHSVLGPMARNSRDAGLFLAAVSGSHPADPLSFDEERNVFSDIEGAPLKGTTIAWSPNAGGLPIDPEIRASFAEARRRLDGLGAVIEDAEIDFAGADEAWETIEMFGFFSFGWPGVKAQPSAYQPDFVRNVRQGRSLTAEKIARGFELRAQLYRRTTQLLGKYDLLITPATPVTAPPVENNWVSEIDGIQFDRYFKWQRLANRITVTGHPALVTPGGFTASGMPFGLQVIGRMRSEESLLSYGAAIEAGTNFVCQRPACVHP